MDNKLYAIENYLQKRPDLGQAVIYMDEYRLPPGRYWNLSDEFKTGISVLEQLVADYWRHEFREEIDRLSIIHAGNTGASRNLSRTIPVSLCRVSVEKGVDFALSWLKSVRTVQTASAALIASIGGIQLEHIYNIGDIKFLPKEYLPKSRQLQKFVENCEISYGPFIHTYALFSFQQDKLFDEYLYDNTLENFRQKCEFVLRVFGYSEKIAATIGKYTCVYIDDVLSELDLPSFHCLSDYSNIILNAFQPSDISEKYFERHQKFDVSKKKKLDIAASRLHQALVKISPSDKIIDLSIALEALLGDGRLDLTYKLKLRGPLLLSKDKTERKMIQKDIQNFYNIRSEVVHGTKDPKLSEEQIKLVERVQEYCCKLIRHFVEVGPIIDWGDVELGWT